MVRASGGGFFFIIYYFVAKIKVTVLCDLSQK